MFARWLCFRPRGRERGERETRRQIKKTFKKNGRRTVFEKKRGETWRRGRGRRRVSEHINNHTASESFFPPFSLSLLRRREFFATALARRGER